MTDATALADTLKAICVAHSNGTLNPYEKAVLRQAAALLEPLSLRLADLTDPKKSAWTDEARAACRAFERQFDVEVVSIEHHAEWVDRLASAEREREGMNETATGFANDALRAERRNADLTRRVAELDKALTALVNWPKSHEAMTRARAALATQAPPTSSTEGKME